MGLTDVGTRGSLLKGMKKVSAYFRSKPSSVYYRKGKTSDDNIQEEENCGTTNARDLKQDKCNYEICEYHLHDLSHACDF